jgi:putative tricarboxylic transport membrane protein
MEALLSLFSIDLLWFMILGITIGIFGGIIPGISGAVVVALALPFTWNLSALQALVLLFSMYTGTGAGGAISAVVLGIPGSPGAVAMVFDGHLMAKDGRAGRALGASLGAAAAGATFGAIMLILFLVPLATFALKFGPPELLMVVLLALLLIGTLRGNSVVKGVLAGLFGVIVGSIGIGPSGASRGILGTTYLLDGFPFIPVLVGMFTIPGLIELARMPRISGTTKEGSRLGDILAGLLAPLRYPLASLQSALLGIGVGLIPAIGGTVSNVAAYNLGRTVSRRGKLFGKGGGHEEGLVYPGVAGGADEAGAAAVLFVLGVPGGSTAAALMGAMILKGWVPGPKMVFDHYDVIQAVVWAELVQALLLIPIGLIVCYYARHLVSVKTSVLIPLLGAIMVLGVYSLRQDPIDVMVAVGFGVAGFFMARADYPVINFLIGLLLGGLVEGELVRTYALYHGRWERIFERPIFDILLILFIALLFVPLVKVLRGRRRSREGPLAADNR